MASSIGGRAVGVVGTLIMTRFLHPDVLGEVNDATILCYTASWLTIWGFGQYTVVNGRGDAKREVTWHATFLYLTLGTLSLGLMALFGAHLTPLLHAEHAAKYIPGMALAVYIKRFGAMPERMLTMQMNFRPSGVSLAVGEAVYTISALSLAALGWGGMSIVIANIIQSIVVVTILISAAGVRSWATPTKLSWKRTKAMLKYGVPLGIQGNAHNASRYWDNLAVSHYFGTGALGAYNMAYNLADIPAIQVGEQIALVLLPSMAELPVERRPRALERSTALLSLIIFPLAFGLGLVAYPLVGMILPGNDWQEVAPLLTVLACLSVFRPITWVLSAYMESLAKTSKLMFLEIAKLGLLLGGIALLSPYGLRTASAAVGIAFGLTAIGGVLMVMREGPSPGKLFVGFMQPLLACGVMAAAVLGVHHGLRIAGFEHPWIYVVTEIVVGAVAYTAAALVICRETSKDLLGLIKQGMRKG